MWYRKAQVTTSPEAPVAPVQSPAPVAPVQSPAPVADSTALSGYQTEINKILALPGKTFNEIYTALSNYKISIDLSGTIDKATKAGAVALIDTSLTNLTNQAAGDFNKVYVPQPQTTPTGQASDPNNPLAAAIQPLSGGLVAPGGGGQLSADRIINKNLPPPPPAGSPVGAQGAPGAQGQAAPGKSLRDALKEAGINNFIFEAMPGNTLPLDDRSFEMVVNNLNASKSLNPGAVATLKSLLANMGVYLTLDKNVMIFSKQKTEATPNPQATFDTVPYKDEK
jgi:hypothetical protein